MSSSSSSSSSSVWVIAFDGSEQSESALSHALTICNDEDDVIALSVVEQDVVRLPGGDLGSVVTPTSKLEHGKRVQERADELLTQWSRATERSGRTLSKLVQSADVREGIVSAAKELNARYIVSGSRGSGGVMRMLLGSVSDYLCRYVTECPVLVTRERSTVLGAEDRNAKHVWALALDGSEESERALDSALRLVKPKRNDTLNVLMVIDTYWAPAETEDVLDIDGAQRQQEAARAYSTHVSKMLAEKGVEHTVTLIDTGNDVREEICAFVEKVEANYLVMGSRGRGGVTRVLLGSVSDYVVRHAFCPVFIIR
jgi:nucleotide-binding universal stress UspA family protein